MFVPQKALNGRHLTNALFIWVMERKWRCLAKEGAQEGTDRAHTAYVVPLSQVTPFKCLERVIAVEDDDWTEVVRNIQRARQKWERLTRVLSREGEDARTSGQIYLAVVQPVLLYGSDTWVLTPYMQRVMGISHHGVARRLIGKQPQKERDGGWFYPPLEDAMAGTGLQEVETYVSRCQNTVAQYIETRHIMDLCLVEKQRPGPRVAMRWWEQEGLDL